MGIIIFTFIVILFCLEAACSACFIENENSGSILGSHEKTYGSFTDCWIIPVPKDSYVTLQINNLLMKGSCSDVHLKIFSDDLNKQNTFCDLSIPELTLTALSDVTISYNHTATNNWYSVSSFALDYFRESLVCTHADHFRCSGHHCIPKSQVCDWTKDCEDGSDEKDCDRGIASVEGAKAVQTLALKWLLRRATYSWDKDIHRVITALHLAQDGYDFEEDAVEKELTKELMTKQLELQILVALLRNSTEPIPVSELSMFVNALIVTCHNPRQFYGYDMIKILYERVSITETPCPGAYLALCNSGWLFSQYDASELFGLLEKTSVFPFFTDIQAMTVMALSCIRNKHEEHSDLFSNSSIFNETIDYFIENQLSDGSFGNAYRTALITQALISSGQENNRQWDMSSTVNYFKNYFNSASSLDFLLVYLVLPIFSSRSLVDIGNANCKNLYRKLEENDISDVLERLDEKMFIQYSLFVGDEKDVVHTIYLKMPKNSSAYELMRKAQANDAKYRFLHSFKYGGIYVYQVAGITNDPETGKFWLLYTKNNETKTFKSHTESPDKLVLKDGEHLVMWYKTARI